MFAAVRSSILTHTQHTDINYAGTREKARTHTHTPTGSNSYKQLHTVYKVAEQPRAKTHTHTQNTTDKPANLEAHDYCKRKQQQQPKTVRVRRVLSIGCIGSHRQFLIRVSLSLATRRAGGTYVLIIAFHSHCACAVRAFTRIVIVI